MKLQKGVEMELLNYRKMSRHGSCENEVAEIPFYISNSVQKTKDNYVSADARVSDAATKVAAKRSHLKRYKNQLRLAEDDLVRAQKWMRFSAKEAEIANAKAKCSEEKAKDAKKRIEGLRELEKKIRVDLANAQNVAITAKKEAKISDERASQTKARLKTVQSTSKIEMTRADAETIKEDELESDARNLRQILKNATLRAQERRLKVEVINACPEMNKEQIDTFESFQKELIVESKGTKFKSVNLPVSAHDIIVRYIRKCRSKPKERPNNMEKIMIVADDLNKAENTREIYQKLFDEYTHRTKIQTKVAAVARKKSDESIAIAEKLAEYADEEREAANMRLVASERAEASVKNYDALHTSVEYQIAKAEQSFEEASDNALDSRYRAYYLNSKAESTKDITSFMKEVEIKKNTIVLAQNEYKNAQQQKDQADLTAIELKHKLDIDSEIFYKSRVEASTLLHRNNAHNLLEQKAVIAYKRFKYLNKISLATKEKAIISCSLAAEKALALKRTMDYRNKRLKVRSISLELAKITLFHSLKFRYWENSLALPFHYMHNISESKTIQIIQGNKMEVVKWREFNKHHLTRIYSKQKILQNPLRNFNPIIPWSIGCQIVCINHKPCDPYVLVNDGRFRVNGSCGYVLKPDYMTDFVKYSQTLTPNTPDPECWNFRVLCGHNISRPTKKTMTGRINPLVKISLYDGGISNPCVHVTKVVKANGLCPVWNEALGVTFHVLEPVVAVILVTLWDWHEGNSTEELISASAVPVSSLREGYRSVALFDSNHRRCGAHLYSSLLLKVSCEKRKNTDRP